MKVAEVITENLTANLGSFNKVELQDEDTGETYCVKIKSGQMISVKGTCDAPVQSSEPEPSSEEQVVSSTEEPTSEPTPTPEPTPQPSPEATAGTAEPTPESTPELIPEPTPESTPEPTPESTPEATPESAPEIPAE